MKKVSKTRLKYVATTICLRKHSKLDTPELLDAIIQELETYNKLEFVYFRGARDENGLNTRITSEAVNGFFFDVLIESVFYRVAF